MYKIWLFYPMPLRDKLDKALQSLGGWIGSGSDGCERDHSLLVDDYESVVDLLPDDGWIKMWHRPSRE